MTKRTDLCEQVQDLLAALTASRDDEARRASEDMARVAGELQRREKEWLDMRAGNTYVYIYIYIYIYI